MTIYSVNDPLFASYGQVVTGLEDAVAQILPALSEIPLPEGTGYVPTEPKLQNLPAAEVIRDHCFGGMPTELGWCCGDNRKLNCLEYHRDSEFNLSGDDFILLLAKQDEIEEGFLDTSKVKAFLVPAGTLVEVFATTLHYAPCCTDSTLTAAPHGVITTTDDGQVVYTRDITTKSDPFVFDKDQEWERTGDPGEVYRKVMGYNDNLMMVKVKFKKGSEGKLHSHPHCQITYVESGAFEFTINGETKIVRAGDVLMKVPNVEHGCKCIEDGVLIDTFTPMRSTFLKK